MQQTMRAMVLEAPATTLKAMQMAIPRPASGEVLIKVSACGICRTDLHVLDGELSEPVLPLIPGHQIVGRVVETGDDVCGLAVGERIGVPWLGGSCGDCFYCRKQQENLCDHARYTGYQHNGGFAEYCVARADYCFAIPDGFDDIQAAPLLCAGLIGHRAHRMAGPAQNLGIYGFGAAAHILTQVACHQGQKVHAFTREGDQAAQDFARSLGAVWAGSSKQSAPVELDAAIIFAPAGELVPRALQAVRKGGRVVCGGIHMSEIPAFSYELLWGERSICSVANLTRQDGEAFLPLAAAIPIRTEVHRYVLEQADQALEDLRYGRFTGAAVIVP